MSKKYSSISLQTALHSIVALFNSVPKDINNNSRTRIIFFNFFSAPTYNALDFIAHFLRLNNVSVISKNFEDDEQGGASRNHSQGSLFCQDNNENNATIFHGTYTHNAKTWESFKKFISQGQVNFILFVDYATIQEIKKGTIDVVICNINEKLTVSDINTIQKIFAFLSQSKEYLQEIFNYKHDASLETICFFMKYASLTRLNLWKKFIKEIDENSKISIINNSSLFDLMTFFFQKNKRMFCVAWESITQTYSEEFLFYYIMEQVWMAYTICYKYEKKQLISMQEWQKKLCWWFVQGGYKQYNSSDFSGLFENMYQQYIIAKYHGREKNLFRDAIINWFEK